MRTPAHLGQAPRLPAQWLAPAWDRAEHDPFQRPATVVAPAPKPLASAQPATVPPPPAPVLPSPPPLTYRFLGRMRSPDGQTLVLLSNGSEVVAATAGVALDDGYIIERVSADAVHLQHTAPDATRSLALPPDAGLEDARHGS
jgi:hypothetical protein